MMDWIRGVIESVQGRSLNEKADPAEIVEGDKSEYVDEGGDGQDRYVGEGGDGTTSAFNDGVTVNSDKR